MYSPSFFFLTFLEKDARYTFWTNDYWATTDSYTNCGGYLYSQSDSFSSPNYPARYPNNAYCTWYIRPSSSSGQIVQLDFPVLDLENDPSCRYDAVYIYDGSSTSSRLLGKVCDGNGTTFHSSGTYLTVRFRSDSIINSPGFIANYSVVGSCRHNCGNNVRDCSCTSICQIRGDCCPDFEDYCSSTAWYPDPTTEYTTGQPSCRYSCGSHMGSCSCSYSCQYYGNCCHDFNYYCSSTTWSPEYTTEQPSCRYSCGSHMGSCSCSYSCKHNGNCCHDFNSYCYKTTESPALTTEQPSCRYRCGSHMGSCSCSSSCQYYGNCCHDFNYYCSSTTWYPEYTTEQPSCRYSCGSHMGSCSCSYSCKHNGNCCHDFNSYCYKTTESPALTTEQPSCRYRCGSHMGSCSCRSSCEYYGNCCDDYYSYCYHTTETTLDPYATEMPCGGSLFGSGTFSSPNYPSYYHDNAYCVWQLKGSFDQRIYLAFTFLQLDNCCHCDYISVYDGPSVHSQYLGKVCNNSMSSFYSSSNYMTVVFRTDSSVVGRGFNAEFMSSLQPSSGKVDCSSDNMNIVIQRSYLNSLGYDGHSLYLNDPYCRPQVSSYQVVFSFPINTCGTIRKFENGRVLYTNSLRADSSNYGKITRQSHFRLNVTCRMEQDSVSQILYEVGHNDNTSITGTGRFNTSMSFYTYSNFYYKVTEVPYVVSLNQNLYVQVDLRRGDNSLVLYIDTCVASPSPHDFQTRSYDLVRNGCPVDSTYYTYTTGTRAYARFRFKAFKFLRATESVYIQCKVLICPASDYNSVCRHRCNRRKARDVGSEHDSETLVLGPIKMKGLFTFAPYW
ncbi:deleted in malignant brain tumors 1 protein isoform X2 [Scomber scombrus]|uniref:Deleted in malignant brain tumors 1 protein isoform X2 n=1 Tax=Scomber scombrus TaxID=13677 RepID=A0AAV1N2C0_SCOSC